MNYYLGLDLGTGSIKTVLFDVNGKEIATHFIEYPLYQPHNGWSEQEPEDWYQAAVATVKKVMTDSRVSPSDVKGLGISGQMMGAVVGGASDNAAGGVGTGVVAPGRAMTTIGTSGTVFAYSDKPVLDLNKSVYTFCMPVPGAWHFMGSVNSCGASLKWCSSTIRYTGNLTPSILN